MMNHHSVCHLCRYRAARAAKKETSQQVKIFCLVSIGNLLEEGTLLLGNVWKVWKVCQGRLKVSQKILSSNISCSLGAEKQIKYKNKSTLCWYYIIFILIFDLIFFSLKRKFGTPTPLFYHHFILPSLFIFSCQSSSIPTLELIT